MKHKKKISSIFVTIIAIIIFMLAIYIFIGAISSKSKGVTFNYFGHSLHVVATDSMSPEINVGDMVLIKNSDITKVKVGDNVLFKSNDPFLEKMNILHKVEDIRRVDGKIVLATKGLKSDSVVDKQEVTEIIGVYVSKNDVLGKIYLMLTTPIGCIVIVVIVIASILIKKCLIQIFKKE